MIFDVCDSKTGEIIGIVNEKTYGEAVYEAFRLWPETDFRLSSTMSRLPVPKRLLKVNGNRADTVSY